MTLKLDAKKRELTGKKATLLRQNNKIPAVLYGHGIKNENLELDYITFEKVYNEAGESTIIDLAIDNQQPLKTLISDLQHDPIKNRISHVDFLQIKMDEKIHAHIQIKFVGESKIVKEDGGLLVHNITEVEVKCFPGDLIHEIDVDVSQLQNFDDAITIKDLPIPKTIEILHHEPADVVVLATKPKEEKIEEPIATEIPTEAAATEAAATEEKKEEKNNLHATKKEEKK